MTARVETFLLKGADLSIQGEITLELYIPEPPNRLRVDGRYFERYRDSETGLHYYVEFYLVDVYRPRVTWL